MPRVRPKTCHVPGQNMPRSRSSERESVHLPFYVAHTTQSQAGDTGSKGARPTPGSRDPYTSGPTRDPRVIQLCRR
eukprot:4446520-Prymnesium_polylepis.1